MIALELLLGRTAEERATFERDCKLCFATDAGAAVLARLCAVLHPLAHVPGMSEHDHGRHEVVATLWRYGATSATPPEPEQKPEPKRK